MSENEKALVKYGSYDLDAALEEQEALEKYAGGGEFWTLEEGENVARFLPPLLGKGYGKNKNSPFKVVWTHFLNVPGGSRVTFPCPRIEGNKPCPICARGEQLKGTGNPADFERAKAFFAKRRVYANVVNRKLPEQGPVILGFGVTIHEALIALRKNEDVGGDFTHPETGYDIVIARKGSKQNDTEYKVMRHKRETPLGNLEWIEMQHDLNRLVYILTPEQIREKLSGASSAGGHEQAAKPARDVDQPRRQRQPAGPTIERDAIEDAVEVGSADMDIPF